MKTRPDIPAPLTVAVSLTGLEAVALVLQGLSLIPSLKDERMTMGLTSVAFFFIYGGFLAFCAWQLYRLRSWARAPVVLAQLIQLLVGLNFWGSGTRAVAIALVVTAAVALVGIFHPDSLAALESDS